MATFESKRFANITGHGIDFLDVRSEARQIGFGFIQVRLMAVVLTEREPGTIRIISVRKANHREKSYFKEPHGRIGRELIVFQTTELISPISRSRARPSSNEPY